MPLGATPSPACTRDLHLIAELADLAGEAHRVVIEADLVDEERVPAGDGGGHEGPEAVEALQYPAPGVGQADGLFEFGGGDLFAGDPLDFIPEAQDFRLPQLPVAGLLHLGDFHDIDRGVLVEDFVGLLLAVAGGFAHHQVAGFDEGAEAGQLKAHEGFDQGAGVAGQDLFGGLLADFGAGAEAHVNGVGGQDQFLRHEDAEGADHLAALGLGVLQFLDAQAVHFGEDEVQVFHALEAAGLAQIDVPVKFTQDRQKPLVGLQVQVQAFPHGVVSR